MKAMAILPTKPSHYGPLPLCKECEKKMARGSDYIELIFDNYTYKMCMKCFAKFKIQVHEINTSEESNNKKIDDEFNLLDA